MVNVILEILDPMVAYLELIGMYHSRKLAVVRIVPLFPRCQSPLQHCGV